MIFIIIQFTNLSRATYSERVLCYIHAPAHNCRCVDVILCFGKTQDEEKTKIFFGVAHLHKFVKNEMHEMNVREEHPAEYERTLLTML